LPLERLHEIGTQGGPGSLPGFVAGDDDEASVPFEFGAELAEHFPQNALHAIPNDRIPDFARDGRAEGGISGLSRVKIKNQQGANGLRSLLEDFIVVFLSVKPTSERKAPVRRK
jgi:hypothetical protein